MKEEMKVIYMTIEEEIKKGVLDYLIDNELIQIGGYNVTVYANEDNKMFYYRFEVDTPEHSHFLSEWFSEEYNGELKQFFTVDYLDNSTYEKDILITSYDVKDFNVMQN